MNGRKAKALRKHGKDLLIEWLRSVVPEGEDATLINRKNLHEFLSDETHIYANRKILLSAYSLKWIYKKLKRNPSFTLQDLNNSQNTKTGTGYWTN
jgi:hypothetical protein|tara:strand:- start:86 stop:373 length:288 start_codon:yes stop_codon:yes gene_type:complete